MRQSAGTSGLVRVCTLYSGKKKKGEDTNYNTAYYGSCLDETQKFFAMESY